MPAWFTVYARRPAKLRPTELLAALHAADLHMLAEVQDLDEDAVDAAVAALRVTAGEGLDGAQLYYRDPALRPIQIHHWTAADRVAEELEELREDALDPEIDAALADVVEVVALELGYPMLEDMGAVLAWELARVLAHATQGLVRDDDGRWSLVDGGGGFLHGSDDGAAA